MVDSAQAKPDPLTQTDSTSSQNNNSETDSSLSSKENSQTENPVLTTPPPTPDETSSFTSNPEPSPLNSEINNVNDSSSPEPDNLNTHPQTPVNNTNWASASNNNYLSSPNITEPIGFNAASEPPQFPTTPPVEEIQKVKAAPQEEKPKKKLNPKKFVAIIVAVLIFLALAVSGYFIYAYFFRDGKLNDLLKKKEPIELTYWGIWESSENIKPVIDAYQRENSNVTINYEERSPEFYYETLQSRLGKDTGPDIVRLHETWVYPLQNRLSAVPSTVFDENTYETTFYRVTEDTLKIDDSYYAIPLEYDGMALIYNQGLFDKAGIKNPPKTWEEFRDTAEKLTVTEEIDGQKTITQAGAAIGFSTIDNFSDILGLLMAQNGVTFMDEKGNVVFDESISPDGRNLGAEALTFYSLFSKVENLVWNKDFLNLHDAFAEGKVAMIFGSSWRVMNLLNANRNLKIKVAAVPQIPLGENETTNVNWGSFWVEAVAKNSKNEAVAWDFLKFMTEKEQMVDLFTVASETRIFGEPYGRQDLYSTLSSDPYLSPYIRGANTATSWFMCDRTHDGTFNDAIIQAFAEAVDKVNSGASAETAIKEAAQKAQTILTEEKVK